MVNIKTKVPTVNNAFSRSRNTALIERKSLQYTTLSLKVERKKIQTFAISDDPKCLSVHCADQKQHLNPFLLTKIC